MGREEWVPEFLSSPVHARFLFIPLRWKVLSLCRSSVRVGALPSVICEDDEATRVVHAGSSVVPSPVLHGQLLGFPISCRNGVDRGGFRAGKGEAGAGTGGDRSD